MKNISTISEKNYSKCKDCDIRRVVKRYYDNKDKLPIQQKIFYKKCIGKLPQKQKDYRNKRNTQYKDLSRSYVELEYKLKAMEENFLINDSENN